MPANPHKTAHLRALGSISRRLIKYAKNSIHLPWQLEWKEVGMLDLLGV